MKKLYKVEGYISDENDSRDAIASIKSVLDYYGYDHSDLRITKADDYKPWPRWAKNEKFGLYPVYKSKGYIRTVSFTCPWCNLASKGFDYDGVTSKDSYNCIMCKKPIIFHAWILESDKKRESLQCLGKYD